MHHRNLFPEPCSFLAAFLRKIYTAQGEILNAADRFSKYGMYMGPSAQGLLHNHQIEIDFETL